MCLPLKPMWMPLQELQIVPHHPITPQNSQTQTPPPCEPSQDTFLKNIEFTYYHDNIPNIIIQQKLTNTPLYSNKTVEAGHKVLLLSHSTWGNKKNKFRVDFNLEIIFFNDKSTQLSLFAAPFSEVNLNKTKLQMKTHPSHPTP